MLEPEALGGVGVLRLLRERLLIPLLDPIARLLLKGALRLRLRLLLERRWQPLVAQLVLLLVLRRRRRPAQELLVVVIREVAILLVGLLVLLGRLLVAREPRCGVGFSERAIAPGGGPRGAVLRGLLRAEYVRRGQQLRRCRGCRAAIAVGGLRGGQQGGERARQGVDLMRGEHRAICQLRLLLGEHALEAQQQREFPAPRGRGALGGRICLQLRERAVQRAPARGARSQGDGRILALMNETLAHELFRARYVRGTWNGRGHESR